MSQKAASNYENKLIFDSEHNKGLLLIPDNVPLKEARRREGRT